MRLSRLALCAIFASASAFSTDAVLQWTPPTENLDGSAATNIAGSVVYWGCETSGYYPESALVLGETSYTVTGLPAGKQCYFSTTAITEDGVESAFSNEVTIAGGPGESPEPGTLSVEWQESQPMTISFIAFASDTVNTGTTVAPAKPTGTASGDMMIALVGSEDDATTFTGPSGWTQIVSENPGTALMGSAWYKEAGGSEPSSYTWSASQTQTHAAQILTFRKTTGTWNDPSAAANYAANSEGGTVTSITVSGITASADDTLILGYYDDGANSISSGPSGMTQTDYLTPGTYGLAGYYQTGLSAGAVSKSVSTSASDQKVGIIILLREVGGGGTAINAGVASLSLTEQGATVQADVDTSISGALATITLTEQGATVQADVDTSISAALESLSVSELVATVQADVDSNISAAADSFSVTENAATVQADVDTNVSAAADSLAVTENAATVQVGADTAINAGVESLTITEQAAAIALSKSIQAALDTLTLTSLPGTLALDVTIAANQATLTITENAGTILTGSGFVATTDTLSITEQAASLSFDVTVNAGVASLSITQNAAAVALGKAIEASADSFALDGVAATVQADTDISISAAVDTLTINGQQATISGGVVTFVMGSITVTAAIGGRVTSQPAVTDESLSTESAVAGSPTIN